MGSALSTKTAVTSWAAADQMHVLAVGNLDRRMTLEDLFTECVVSPVIKNSNGIDIDTTDGGDGDVDLLTCLVTGTPKLWWDESEDALCITHKLRTSSLAGLQIVTTNSPCSFHAGETLFNGELNTIVYMAYNIAPGTVNTKVDADEASWKWSLEGAYYNGSARFVEANLDYQSIDGGTLRRPMSFMVNKATHEVLYAFRGDVTLFQSGDGLTEFAEFDVNSLTFFETAYALTITPTGQVSMGTLDPVTNVRLTVDCLTGKTQAIRIRGEETKYRSDFQINANGVTIGSVDDTVGSLPITLSGSVVILSNAYAIGNYDEGLTARLTRRCVRELVTLSGATKATTLNIPSGARLLAVQMCVNTAVTDDGGNDTWSAAFSGGSTTAIVSGAAAAKQTKVNLQIVDEIASGTTNITFTPNGGSFTAGVIEVLVYYESLTAMGNAA